MGQAKQRGTYEQRRANPLGSHNSLKNYWTEEKKLEFAASLKVELTEMIGNIQKSLFSPRKPSKQKPRKIKTGG